MWRCWPRCSTRWPARSARRSAATSCWRSASASRDPVVPHLRRRHPGALLHHRPGRRDHRRHQGLHAPRSPISGKRPQSVQVYSIDDLDEYVECLQDIIDGALRPDWRLEVRLLSSSGTGRAHNANGVIRRLSRATKGQDRLRRHELFVEDGCGGLWTTDTGSPIVIRGNGTRFWVVRPALGLLRTENLGTLVSGPYIEALPSSMEPASGWCVRRSACCVPRTSEPWSAAPISRRCRRARVPGGRPRLRRLQPRSGRAPAKADGGVQSLHRRPREYLEGDRDFVGFSREAVEHLQKLMEESNLSTGGHTSCRCRRR